ncbi:MAG: type II secretion system F family protein, partial [Acidobacteria bacterium]|nr:type II secretion system F family protein [Acidobacteriota bacterium]
FYRQFDRELPLSTRIIVAISNFAVAYFFVVVLAIGGATAAAVAWLRRPGNRRRFDRWMLGIPTVGPIAQKFATSQAARTLATLLGGGIPLVNAIDVSARSIGNQHMAHELTTAAQQVREGRALASAMMASGTFPDVAIKMVEVGESTGALQEMLNSLSEFYDEEIETSLTRFITIVEPALLVIMGLVIAALLLSLYMPLFNLSSMIS